MLNVAGRGHFRDITFTSLVRAAAQRCNAIPDVKVLPVFTSLQRVDQDLVCYGFGWVRYRAPVLQGDRGQTESLLDDLSVDAPLHPCNCDAFEFKPENLPSSDSLEKVIGGQFLTSWKVLHDHRHCI